MDQIEELLTRGVANIIPSKETLTAKLRSGEKLNIYLGIDPTATKIHLGHAVALRKLQSFAKLGHHVTFLIGDFTALIGDTSDKDTERPVLSSKQIEENFQTYKKQAEKILDFSLSNVTVKHNSDWLKKLTYDQTVKLIREFSLNDFISRELIKKRLAASSNVGLLETMYPIMQGYDSYFMDTDIQIGGTDQTFNMQAGRTLQKRWRNKESFILATEFLTGTDGRKMSKSWGNAIWLDDNAFDMFAKVMAIDDQVIEEYFILGTNTPPEQIQAVKERLTRGENPMLVKKDLAKKIVSELHSEKEAEDAEKEFAKTVQKKEIPDDIPTLKINDANKGIADAIFELNITDSKAEAKRLIEQGGVMINGKRIKDPSEKIVNYLANSQATMQIGKRKFFRLNLDK